MRLWVKIKPVKRLLSLLVSLILLSSVAAAVQQASLAGNVIHLPVLTFVDQVFQIELSIVEATDPVEVLLTHASELTNANTDGAASFDGVMLSIPSIDVDGTIYWANFRLLSAEPPTFVLGAAGTVASNPPLQSCTRPEPDSSHGPDETTLISGFLVPPSEIFDGGPGPDGIPAIQSPLFSNDFALTDIQPDHLVIGVKIGDDVRAYPHAIMDYHEIVNDRFSFDGFNRDVSLSYCPLTGSAVLWKSFLSSANTSFGVSGLLYNSNLILYDRETQSLWSQMLEQAISGQETRRIPDKLQVVETSWETWLEMYPQTLLLMIEQSEFNFPYDRYPCTDSSLQFPVNNSNDDRLHRKERVLGINVGDSSKVYPISRFAGGVSVVNDRVGDMDVVATGSASQNFAVVYNRQLEDCTTLNFNPVENQLPVVMIDDEGNRWDIFGTALSGPRVGTRLQKTNSYIAYWLAWTAFFPGANIYQ
tara:strand:+ start:4427 stop:5851 length:1425 start_codon:yes stop_codon:yes gene_type:complete